MNSFTKSILVHLGLENKYNYLKKYINAITSLPFYHSRYTRLLCWGKGQNARISVILLIDDSQI